MALIALPQSRFRLGHIVVTAGVDALVQSGALNPVPYLLRHAVGDWGDVCEEDRRTNDNALKQGDRLLSSYQITPTVTLWIITEWDRSVTTLLLPSEY